jgi:hypothetical protein
MLTRLPMHLAQGEECRKAAQSNHEHHELPQHANYCGAWGGLCMAAPMADGNLLQRRLERTEFSIATWT